MAGARQLLARRTSAVLSAAALVIFAVAATITTAAASASRRAGSWRPPPRLADTGLYSDFGSRTIAPGNLPYSPQYPLWSDGATKRRWIHLPPGTFIDARDPEVWRFPVGTRLWKEFSWGRRVETRYLERTSQGWMYAAYRWLDGESDAVLAPDSGVVTAQEVAPGKRHAIPSVGDCKNCHRGGRAEVLGVSALQLSPDRDPLAPHAERLEPGMVTLDVLVRRGLVRNLPRALVDRPPRIDAATARGRAALGYMHANCAICHDVKGPMGSLGVNLRQLVGGTGRGPSASAAVALPTKFQIPGAPRSVWIDPGAPSSSAVLARMASRNPVLQMPPLGTEVVDEQAVALITEWILKDLHPTPGAVGNVPK